MNQSRYRSIGIVLLFVGSLFAFTAAPAAQRTALRSYTLTDLGTLGGDTSEASALNNLGDVVGAAADAGGHARAFLYRGGEMLDLGVLPGGSTSRATAINDRGAIVGASGINAYGPMFREFEQGFVWQDGEMKPLGALYCPCTFNVRYGTSAAFAVSDSGWIVGDSQTTRPTMRRAFAWGESVMRDLGAPLNASQSSSAYGINDTLEVVGAADGRAFLMRDGIRYDLGVLPGHASSAARALNDKGQVAGSSADPAGVSRGFLWDLGAMRALAPLAGDASSEALAINVDGDIVGRSGETGFAASHAVLWRGGAAVDLARLVGAPGWTLESATGINDFGQIAGVGLHDGQRRAFLLSPR